LIKTLAKQFKNIFQTKNSRTRRAQKNIVVSLLLKALSIFVSFALVPITMNYLTTEKYGIWLTLCSILTWFSFFDLGLGQGLRNKFAEAKANRQKDLAKIYVSTAYAVVTITSGIFFLIFLVANNFLSWSSILNAPPELSSELSQLSIIMVICFALNFIFKLIGVILTADQKPAVNSSFNSISSLLCLITVLILTITTSESLLYLGFVMSFIPVIVLIIATIYLFKKNEYRLYRPSIKHIRCKYSKPLFSLGIKFFIIEVAFIIIFSTDNIMITQLFGPKEVTIYNIAFKYFSIVFMFFGIIVTPFWSAITDAYTKHEFSWIKNTINMLLIIMLGMILCSTLMILASNWFYDLWIGPDIQIPAQLTIMMAIYAGLKMWLNIFCYFLNGVGKISMQLYSYIVAAIINIPLSIFLAKDLNFKSTGIMMGTCSTLLIVCLVVTIQYTKIINNKAYGLWNK